MGILTEKFSVGTSDAIQHFVMEAGAHCARGKAPKEHGMVMLKESDNQCNGIEAASIEQQFIESTRPVSPRLNPGLRKPQQPLQHLQQGSEHKHRQHGGGHHHRGSHQQHNNVVVTSNLQPEPTPDSTITVGGGAASQTATCTLLLLSTVFILIQFL